MGNEFLTREQGDYAYETFLDGVRVPVKRWWVAQGMRAAAILETVPGLFAPLHTSLVTEVDDFREEA